MGKIDEVFLRRYPNASHMERLKITATVYIGMACTLVLSYFLFHFIFHKTFQPIVFYIIPAGIFLGVLFLWLVYMGKKEVGAFLYLISISIMVWFTMFFNMENVPMLNTLDTLFYIFTLIIVAPIILDSRGIIFHYLFNFIVYTLFIFLSPVWEIVPDDQRIPYLRDANISLLIVMIISLALDYIYRKSHISLMEANRSLLQENEDKEKINNQLFLKTQDLEFIQKERSLTQESLRELNQALEASRNRYYGLISQANDGFLLLHNNDIVEFNEKTLSLFEIDSESLKYSSVYALLPPDDGEKNFRERLMDAAAKAESGVPQRLEIIFLKGNRQDVLQCEISIARFQEVDDGEKNYLSIFIRDIAGDKKNREFMELASRIFETSTEGFIVTNEKNIITMVNSAFTEITGYTKEEAIGKNPALLRSGRHDEKFYRNMWESLTGSGEWKGEIWNRNKYGIEYAEYLRISAIKDQSGRIRQYIAIFNDLTDLKSRQFQLDYMENFDILTGLAKRDSMLHEIAEAIENSQSAFGLMVIGIDNMSKINNKYGYKAGDEVLKKFAERIRGMQDSNLFGARIESDEFAILVKNLKNKEDITVSVFAIKKILKTPLIIHGKAMEISAGIGIAFAEEKETPFTLLDKAYLALQSAKKKGANSHQLYTPYLDELTQVRLNIENDLKKAVDNAEFIMVYQPKYSMIDQKIVGFESLIRWEKDGKMISPISFISIAEENGTIGDIGRIALESTASFTSILLHAGITDFSIAINVSPLQLKLGNFADDVERILKKYSVPPENIQIEITESALLYEESAINPLLQIRKMGVKIALDDFGTGYSSLSYLRRLPVDILKIDKSFVDDIPGDQSAVSTIRTILDLANNYHLDVVTEGVETLEQKEFLENLGCDVIQGYFISKPVLPDDAMAMMQKNP